MALTKAITRVEFPAATDVKAAEALIQRMRETKFEAEAQAFLPTTFRRDIFADVWVAIALGTMVREHPSTAAVVWGIHDRAKFSERNFATSPAGLVSTFLARDVRMDDRSSSPIDMTPVRTWIEYERQGLLADEIEGNRSARTLVEHDNHRAFALTALSEKKHAGKPFTARVFKQFVHNTRKQLEFWYEGHKVDGGKVDPADPLKLDAQNVDPRGDDAQTVDLQDTDPITCLSEFIRELFENAHQHGRDQRFDRQFRFLRFRKITDHDKRLRERAGPQFDLLRNHILHDIDHHNAEGFLEVVVSDFGRGILDHFLTSAAGMKYADEERRGVLDRLLYKKLSSKAHDTSAGLGILNALTAAQRLGAFVSVRTGEFWLAKSFAQDTESCLLEDVGPRPFCQVAGTHWQFLWKIPN